MPDVRSSSFLLRFKILACCLAVMARAGGCGEGETVELPEPPIERKLKLTSIDGADQKILRQFEVTLSGKPVQTLAAGGIRLAVTVFNKGSTAAIIENPVDYLTYMLRNPAGQQVAMPRPKARDEVLSTKDARREPRKLAFNLLSLAMNERQMSAREIDEDTLKLEPGAKLRLEFEIDKAAKAPYVSPGVPELAPLSAGLYNMTLRVTLLLHREDGSAWFESPLFDDSACVRVTLAPNP